MFKILFFGLISSIFAKRNTSAVTQFTVKNCGINTDLIQNVLLSVDPILPQTDYTLSIDGDLSKEVTGGESQYDVTYNFIPFSPTIHDLCTEIKDTNTTCPLKIGNIGIQSKGTIPNGLSGSLTIKNQWFDLTGARILCMVFNIKI